MRKIFFSFVIMSAISLVGILLAAVLVDYQVISRMYFDLVIVLSLCLSVIGMFIGFFLEILE